MMKLLRVVLLCWSSALVLSACVGTTATGERLPALSTLAPGEGLAFGSILLVTPETVEDPAQRERIEALRERKVIGTMRHFVRHGEPGGAFTWRDYDGDEFVVPCRVDGEQVFVLRGPAGPYQVELTDYHSGLFGDEKGCGIDNLGSFEVRAGRARYVGRIVLRVGFKSKWEEALARVDGVWGFPEQYLDMTFTVDDVKEATLAEVGRDSAISPSDVEVGLLDVGHGRWVFTPPPKPEFPKPPGSN